MSAHKRAEGPKGVAVSAEHCPRCARELRRTRCERMRERVEARVEQAIDDVAIVGMAYALGFLVLRVATDALLRPRGNA